MGLFKKLDNLAGSFAAGLGPGLSVGTQVGMARTQAGLQAGRLEEQRDTKKATEIRNQFLAGDEDGAIQAAEDAGLNRLKVELESRKSSGLRIDTEALGAASAGARQAMETMDVGSVEGRATAQKQITAMGPGLAAGLADPRFAPTPVPGPGAVVGFPDGAAPTSGPGFQDRLLGTQTQRTSSPVVAGARGALETATKMSASIQAITRAYSLIDPTSTAASYAQALDGYEKALVAGGVSVEEARENINGLKRGGQTMRDQFAVGMIQTMKRDPAAMEAWLFTYGNVSSWVSDRFQIAAKTSRKELGDERISEAWEAGSKYLTLSEMVRATDKKESLKLIYLAADELESIDTRLAESLRASASSVVQAAEMVTWKKRQMEYADWAMTPEGRKNAYDLGANLYNLWPADVKGTMTLDRWGKLSKHEEPIFLGPPPTDFERTVQLQKEIEADAQTLDAKVRAGASVEAQIEMVDNVNRNLEKTEEEERKRLENSLLALGWLKEGNQLVPPFMKQTQVTDMFKPPEPTPWSRSSLDQRLQGIGMPSAAGAYSTRGR